MTEWWWLAGGVLLTAGTGVAVAAEFSLVTVERGSVERAADEGDRSAARVLRSVRTLSTQLSGAQVAISFTTLLVGYLVEPSLATLLRTPFESIGVPAGVVGPLAVAVAMFAATMFSMLFGELVPKNLAIAQPLRTARWSAPAQYVFTMITSPLIKVLNGSANGVVRAIGLEPQEELSTGRTPEELAAVVRHSAAEGTLDRRTAARVRRTLDFGRWTASDVMVHRIHVATVDHDASAADVIDVTRRTGRSKFPVVRGTADDVVGIVHLKSAVAVPVDRRDQVPVTDLMTEVMRVPDSLRLDALMVDLKDRGLPLAIVQDEYGGTAGIVTLEDVVEEVVGDVADENDPVPVAVTREDDGSWLVAGTLRPDEVRQATGVDIPDGTDYDTVAGYLLLRLGRIAEQGDVVEMPGGRLEVERLEGRQIERLRFRPGDGEPTP